MEIWVFLAKHIRQKPASEYHPGTLAVLVKCNEAKKCLRYDPKYLHKIVMKFLKQWNFLLTTCSPAHPPACLMPSGKCNLITAKATG